jgi:hypothetical protein
MAALSTEEWLAFLQRDCTYGPTFDLATRREIA